MDMNCIWEHNGNDSLLYCIDYPGAYTRGNSLDVCISKMHSECRSYFRWLGVKIPEQIEVRVIQDASCDLEVRDADSDVLFESEKAPLTMEEYLKLKELALKSALDFYSLFESVPDPDRVLSVPRYTFYGQVPNTASQMYIHTKNVNAYYFGEIDVDADNEGTIYECRKRGFEMLEQKQDFLDNPIIEGSYGEAWTLRKVLRRFIWHDRIHAKAMYRKCVRLFGKENMVNPFFFEAE